MLIGGIKMNVDKKHIVKLQGKDFITYDGLLDMAHQMGLYSCKTEPIEITETRAVIKATIKANYDGVELEFDGIGDADKTNTNSMIAKHYIRMAETRAKARACRDLTNVGMCSVEELGGDDAPATKDTAEEVFDAPDKDIDEYFGEQEAPKQYATGKQTGYIQKLCKDKSINDDALADLLSEYNVKTPAELTKKEASDLIDMIQSGKQ